MLSKSTEEGADDLTEEVMLETNASCWGDVSAIQWTFGNRKQLWDKDRDFYLVERKNKKMVVNLSNPQQGFYYKKGKLKEGCGKRKNLKKAYKYWANDSYWLNPFWKFMENGVNRRTYVDENGLRHLIIYYSKGKKVGDLYDWTIDSTNRPTQWNLFVKIVPIKNFRFTWEAWQQFDCLLQISTKHVSSLATIQLKEVKRIEDWEESEYKKDPFFELLKP